MDKTDKDGTGNGAGVTATQVPHLIITWVQRKWSIEIGGSVPTWEFAEALLHMAVKETERKIQEGRVRKQIEVATPGFVLDGFNLPRKP